MKKIIIVFLLAFLGMVSFSVFNYWKNKKIIASISSFTECSKHYPVLESYPRQCRTPDGKNFVENIGNAIEKQDLIRLSAPFPNAKVSSPLAIMGKARGNWYFEAVFPVEILDSNNNVLGQGSAQAQGEWMTTDFVPFTMTIQFEVPQTATGTLVLKKDNPSGLPQNDDRLVVPVVFSE